MVATPPNHRRGWRGKTSEDVAPPGKTLAEISAHERGHLLGGQRELATCGEGASSVEELRPGLHFGTVNGRIVRGYALRYAAAND